MRSFVALSALVLLAGCAHDPNGDVVITVPLHRLHHHRPMPVKAPPLAEQPTLAPEPVVVPPPAVVPAPAPAPASVVKKPTRRSRVHAYLRSRHILP